MQTDLFRSTTIAAHPTFIFLPQFPRITLFIFSYIQSTQTYPILAAFQPCYLEVSIRLTKVNEINLGSKSNKISTL